MSRGLKLFLWIGIPVVVVVLVVTTLFLSSRRLDFATSGSYNELGLGDSYGGGEFAVGMAYDVSPSVPGEQEASKETRARDVDGSPSSGGAQTTSANTQDRLVIKTGNMSVVVKDVVSAMKTITDYAVEKGGFVVSSNIYKSGLSPRGEVIVRVPAATFDESIDTVKKMGEVTSQRTSGQDVTEEYVDLDAQLRNLRATETQFLEIMKKAVKIEDILAVQNELSNVRGRIESIQGSMKYLKQSADLSTLTVYLSTDPEILPTFDNTDTWKPWAVVKNAFRQLVDVGKGLVDVLIWVGVFTPLWLAIGLVVWIIVRIVRRA